MSFDCLPDELLVKIAQQFSEVCLVDATFKGDAHPPSTTADPHIYCKDQGIIPLSLVSSRMRRICLPSLFSEIVFRIEDWGTEYAVVLFRYLILLRPHLRGYIKKILISSPDCFYPNWYGNLCVFYGDSQLFVPVLQHLPGLNEVPRFSSLTVDFVRAVNAHDSLLDVSVSHRSLKSIIVASSDSTFSQLNKFQISCVGIHDIYNNPDFVVGTRLGMRVHGLHLDVTPESTHILAHAPVIEGLAALNVWYEQVSIPPLTRVLPWWIQSVLKRQYGVLEIQVGGRASRLLDIAGHADQSDSEPDIPDCSPVLSRDINLCGTVDKKDLAAIDENILVTQYRFAREKRTLSGEDQPGHSASWNVTNISLSCDFGPVAWRAISRIGSLLPLVSILDLDNDNIESTSNANFTLLAVDPVALADALATFQHLEQLYVQNTRSPLSDCMENADQLKNFHVRLADALKARIPFFCHMIARGDAPPGGDRTYFMRLGTRKRLLSEGGNIETCVQYCYMPSR